MDDSDTNDHQIQGDDSTPIEAIPAVPADSLTAADAAIVNMQQERNIPPQPENPQQEKDLIKNIETEAADEGLKLGQTWYIINARWWQQWKEYVSYETFHSSIKSEGPNTRPPPIENESLTEDGDEPGEERVRKNMNENYDFVVVTENTWFHLHHWYGGGPALPRKVVSSGWSSTNLTVEIRQLCLKVTKSSAMTEVVLGNFSKTDTIGNFKKVMCKKLGLDENEVRVWDYHGNSKYKLLEDMKQKMEAAQIIDGQPMMLEEKGPDGKFPEAPKRPSYGMMSGGSSYSSGYAQPTDPGTTGLINLGNTCFMNSSLQCLSNTPPLINYFISNDFKREINADNPLGMKGEIAEEYGDLVKELWAGTHSAVAPRGLKSKIERFAPQFAGYQQHDSQELLAFLLDGLHEDLNRVRTKPYVENPEVDDRPEAEVANEAWSRHKSRNDSKIVDYFQGQLKSTLVCPKCNKVSITFDPFMHLSLPLPMKNTRTVKLTFFPLDPTIAPLKLAVEVVKYGAIKDLKKALGEIVKVNPESIVICDIYSSRFFKHFNNDADSVDSIQDRDVIHAYEILLPSEENPKVVHFPIMYRKEEKPYNSYGSKSAKSLFGLPFVLSVPNSDDLTYKKLYELVYTQIQRFLKEVPTGKVVRSIDRMVEDDGKSTDEDAPIKKEEPSEDEDVDRGQVKKKKAVPLFTLMCVDSYGSEEKDQLPDNDKVIDLDDRQNLAISWTEASQERFYNEQAERDFRIHESLQKPEEKEGDDSIALNTCIDLFTATEKLGPDDPWYCSRCKEFQQATKKFDLWKLPPVLVVHLKRFSYKNRYWREKLETFVDYPLHDLDLSNVVQGPFPIPPVYDLYAVSNHYGSLGGGHYVAHAKNKNDKKWYKFDDSNVSKIDESKVKSSSAYVLFYIRKDVNTAQPAPSSTAAPAGDATNDSKQEANDADTQPMEHDHVSSQNSDGMEEVSR